MSPLCCRSHEYLPHDKLIEPYLQQADFGNVINIECYSVDYKFILSLVERWRPETRTFHLSCGECTVTLEDVYILLGIHIEGKAINGQVNLDNALCEQLLGVDLFEDTPNGQGINLKYLKKTFKYELTANSTEDEKIRKNQCYIMILFGKILFEKTGNSVNIMYLPLLRDLTKTRAYSWGLAILSHLYSSLCKNAQRDTCSFFSCAFCSKHGVGQEF